MLTVVRVNPQETRQGRSFMARAGDELVDPNTGERMIFRKTAKETDGELLQLDWIGKAGRQDHFTSTLTRRSALRSSPAP